MVELVGYALEGMPPHARADQRQGPSSPTVWLIATRVVGYAMSN